MRTGPRPETASPVFTELAPPMGELYANPSASQAMLDDAAFDVEQWLAEEIAAEFARAEGAAFVTGNGVNRPKGFLTGPTSTAKDGVRPLGTLQYLPSGAASDFGANPDERLIDLVQSVRAPYRQGASWVMNASTLARIRKFKTGDGTPLWQPGLAAGQPAMLLGYALRGGEAEVVAARFDAVLARGDGSVGDVLLFRVGPGQLHGAVRVAGGIVHADAALRRVVMRPGVPDWVPIGAWRYDGRG